MGGVSCFRKDFQNWVCCCCCFCWFFGCRNSRRLLSGFVLGRESGFRLVDRNPTDGIFGGFGLGLLSAMRDRMEGRSNLGEREGHSICGGWVYRIDPYSSCRGLIGSMQFSSIVAWPLFSQYFSTFLDERGSRKKSEPALLRNGWSCRNIGRNKVFGALVSPRRSGKTQDNCKTRE